MADQTLAALRELTEAVMAEFFGNDTNLSKRLIKATNEAQLLLMVQPPDDGRVNHSPGATEMVPPPAEGEVGELVGKLGWIAAQCADIGWPDDSITVDRAADLLQQQAAELAMLRQRVAPVPVPVSERPWTNEAGWLDPDGECWWCPPGGPAYWSMANPAMVYGGWLLPAHAIPVPPENRPNG